MSAENVKKFLDELEKNSELGKKFEQEMGKCAEQTEKIYLDKIIEFAKKAGFECPAESLRKLMEESGEVSDDDMMKVAGGISKAPPRNAFPAVGVFRFRIFPKDNFPRHEA